jgi:hypothetical protein
MTARDASEFYIHNKKRQAKHMCVYVSIVYWNICLAIFTRVDRTDSSNIFAPVILFFVYHW